MRCALIGNSFHTLAVASILGAQLAELGHHSLYASPAALHERFISELLTHSQTIELHMADELAAAGVVVEASGVISGDALREEERLEATEVHGNLMNVADPDLEASTSFAGLRDMRWLSEAHVRASEPRGGDIRADLAVPMQPRA